MSNISIHRPHRLTQKQAVVIAKKISAELEQRYAITSTWSGEEVVHVKGTGLTGKLCLKPGLLELDIKLGFVMSMFRDSIREGVEQKLDKLLAAKPSRKK